jgi:hypothetical protein
MYRLLVLYIQAADLKLICQEGKMSPLNSEVLQQLQLNYQVAVVYLSPVWKFQQLPSFAILSPTLKKQIPVLEGRDVNLAALLMKDYESVQAANSLHIQAADLKLFCQESINLHLNYQVAGIYLSPVWKFQQLPSFAIYYT